LAAWGGHLQTLQWAREHHCPWDARTCACAAAGGHLEVLRWAREHGGEWDTRTCEYAALGGYLEVLRWARAPLPVGQGYVSSGRSGRAPGGAEVGAGARLRMGRGGV